MNATPIQPDPNDREELARLLPEPMARDLPSGRHQRLQEFVMSQIHQDLRTGEQTARRSPKRRPVVLVAALTAVAGATAATVVIAGGSDSSRSPGAVRHSAASLSGRQILLAAAGTAERTPAASGTYWHVKTVAVESENEQPLQWESWTRRDGQTWFKGARTAGKVTKIAHPTPFRLGGPEVSFGQLQKLPTEPDALKAWITSFVKHGGVRTSAGPLDAAGQRRAVFTGLISLVSQLPAPPKVRAAAFRAIASYPDVKNLGAVRGGQGLSISPPVLRPPAPTHSPSDEDQAERDAAQKVRDEAQKARGGAGSGRYLLIVDPATSQIRETNFFISPDGAETTVPGRATLVAEWTNLLPR